MRYLSNLFIILVSFNGLPTFAAEDIEIGTVRIATGAYPPYYAASLPGGGPVAVNIMRACELANLDCVIEFLPWNRVLLVLEAGEIDMTFAWSITEERLNAYVFSREAVVFGHVSTFFIRSRFPNGIHFAKYQDLVGYTMLGDEGSWYAADFKKIGVDTVWIPIGANRWKMLEAGKGDAFLADTYQALYTLRRWDYGLSGAFKEEVGFTEKSYSDESEFYDRLMFSKANFDGRRQRIRDSMDKALDKLDIMTTVRKILDEQYSRDVLQVQ